MKLQLDKFLRILELSILFSFFLYGISWISLNFILSLQELLIDTFLSSFSNLIVLFFGIFLTGLKYITLLFFVGCLLALIITFIMDLIINPIKN